MLRKLFNGQVNKDYDGRKVSEFPYHVIPKFCRRKNMENRQNKGDYNRCFKKDYWERSPIDFTERL